ncbi:MAG: aspartate-semialdehyde dehydrogenase [Candidatus Cloacimonetes bacterium]|nr:aspartate-semialdehyde dehydrogenase [Candidatus Cloacimonadota bacterium]
MKLAVVGATGEVGRMMMTCLEEFAVPVASLELFASARSAGETLYFGDTALTVRELDAAGMRENFDYVLFSAGAGVAREFAPIAAASGSVVIDNSSGFRQDADIPLVVPEINGSLLQGYQGIVANPNCTTIQMVLPLAVLNRLFGLTKLVVSTYQSVSGSGHKGVTTLQDQRAGGSGKGIYPDIIDLNVIPQIGAFADNGYSQEEEKIHFETRKILDLPDLEACATTVRVPVYYGHSESIYAEFASKADLALAARELQQADSIAFQENTYITPRDLGSSNDSHVCRLRRGPGQNSLCFWNVGHNVRLGAATNAVRILLKHAQLAGRI